MRLGAQANVVGRLVDGAGQGIPNAELQVLSRTPIHPEQVVAAVSTDSQGGFRYSAPASMNRWLRFAFAGSSRVLPTSGEVSVAVPAETSLHADRRRLLNGQAVSFSGRLRAVPAPFASKLVEVQVLLSGRWQTFRTLRTDASGRWSAKYRFRRTRGVVRYRFRARLPAEAGYPLLAGSSRPLEIRVRGRS
jgi:hypothetical protein